MQRILLAVDNRQLEDYITEETKNTHIIIGSLVHKDSIINMVGEKEPDILVIRETLQGKEDLLEIIYHLSVKYPNLRVVYISKKREAGDQLLASLVSLRVYDIIPSGKVSGFDIMNAILNPKEYSDVSHYVPMPSYSEDDNKIIFKAPEIERENRTVIAFDSGSIEKPREIKDEGPETQGSTLEVEESAPETNVLGSEDGKSKETKNTKPFGGKLFDGIGKIVSSIPEKKPVEKVKKEPQVNQINISGDSSRKIITFLGGKRGVGTSAIAFNTAISLADKGKKVIYLELNKKSPSTAFLYNLSKATAGIETALSGINNGNYGAINEAIVKTSELKESENKSLYKSFPDTIDFMFFSKEFLVGMSQEQNLNNSKDLYLNLMFQHSYDYVVIDTNSDMDEPMTKEAIVYSNAIFTVVTQDISTMGYQMFKLEELQNSGIQINEKNNFILNKYVDSEFGGNEVVDYLNISSLVVVPFRGKEFFESGNKGVPIIKETRDQTILNSFSNILVRVLGSY